MRISRLSLKNVGPFDDAALEFPEPEGDGELVLFEGPNGSGKTTIAEAIAVLVGQSRGPRAASGKITATAMPWQVFNTRIRGGEASATFSHGESSIDVVQTNPMVGSTRTASPVTELIDDFNLAGFSPIDPSKRLGWATFAFKAHTPSATLDSQGPREIAEHPLKGTLGFGAGYCASASLGQLLMNMEFERIQNAQYATERSEGAERFRIAAEDRRKALLRFEHAFSTLLSRNVSFVFLPGRLAPQMLFDGEEIPIDLLGEGMRSTVSWLADLLVRLERIPWADTERSPFEQEFWLILDEIEASLHPRMQMRLLPALRELFPRARIYATTHSPFVVASAGEGHVFSIRPDPATHRVSGIIEPKKLEPGQSLEWVVESIFSTPTGIIDPETRASLETHQHEVNALRGGQEIDWPQFLKRREELVGLNDEVSTIVRMAEGPVRKTIETKLREASGS